MQPTMKHGGRFVMVWAAISWFSAGPIIVLQGTVTASEFVTIFDDHVHLMVQSLFPDGDYVYQDDKSPVYTAEIIQDWFSEHMGEVSHLPWTPQSPNLSIIEPL